MKPLVAVLLVVIGTAACTSPLVGRGAAPAPSPRGGQVASDWMTLTDVAYGFTLRYPAGWTETISQPPGFHAIASREGMESLRDLRAEDSWLVAYAFARDASTGCGEPIDSAQQAASTLGGQPATRFVIRNDQMDANPSVIEVITVRNGTCYTLQLSSGPGVSVQRALGTLQSIQDTYRFS